MPNTDIRTYKTIDNYIYLYHLDKFLVIPTYPDSLQDNMGVTFSSQTPLSRSAPIYSYANSGPRSMSITLNLHREMFNQINYSRSNFAKDLSDDYVDLLIKHMHAMALPVYGASSKLVDPPMIAIRFGNDIFCKGVVTGTVSVDYNLPIISNGKYASVGIGFTISEVDPYDAQTVITQGSYRGLDYKNNLERNTWAMQATPTNYTNMQNTRMTR